LEIDLDFLPEISVKMIFSSSSRLLYDEYRVQMRKIADVKNASAVLQWDQETYMPEKATAFRAAQIASLSELSHQLFTHESMGAILQELQSRDDLAEDEQINVALTWEDFNKQKKYPGAFVRSLSETASRSFHSWVQARKQNAFPVFAPDLAILIDLKKQETDLLGYDRHPYDALLNEFEKGCTVDMLDRLFPAVRQPLKDLLDRISQKPAPDDRFLRRHYPSQLQWDFGMQLILGAGFDFGAGRQDISEHPFTTSFSPDDVRITTRVDEENLDRMVWSCIHETGHALYEQGLPRPQYGLPLGEYTSLGIHESQSRLWENQVGRSLPYWTFWFPTLQSIFPDNLRAVSLKDFYAGINRVEPTYIRTEADELTYHFHIMIRYELEKAVLEGALRVGDISAWWKEQYRNWLGLEPLDDNRGCLQDVHWSHGSFGYFPTYSLGSFYAAQFFERAVQEIPGLTRTLSEGHTKPLLDWLRISIHQYGKRYRSAELCEKVTGKPLDFQSFLNYLLDKYQKIYDL
jgi:carboxypeptidase Taq